MFSLPWRWTKAARPDRAVVFASRFDAKGLKTRWVLLAGGVRIRRAVLASPGALGVSLRAHPIAGRYYTLSMWRDEASLLDFAHGAAHRAAVTRISGLGSVNGVLISRDHACTRPRWSDILDWVSSTQPGPYHKDEPEEGGTKERVTA